MTTPILPLTLREYQPHRTDVPTEHRAYYCARCDVVEVTSRHTRPVQCPCCGAHDPVFVGYYNPKPARKRHTQHEAEEQRLLFQWAEQNTIIFPDLALLYHIPNGGKRDPKEAAKLKAEGVKPGVPDIHLPVPRGGYHGLWIELKAGDNGTTRHQSWWLAQLEAQGYATMVCYGAKQAAEVLRNYLKLPIPAKE